LWNLVEGKINNNTKNTGRLYLERMALANILSMSQVNLNLVFFSSPTNELIVIFFIRMY